MMLKHIPLALCMLGFSAVTQAAMFTFSGNIASHNDIVRVDFNLANDATNVRVWTDSYLSGTNFDPITALWNNTTGALIVENDDNDEVDPSQTPLDSGFSLTSLAAGNYFFTMAVYPNFSNGTNISDGFEGDDETPRALTTGTFWRINLDGVNGAAGPVDPNPSEVPVPGAIWLFGSALLGFAGFGRKKSI